MILDISTILLTTIIRSDAHEFQIGEILKRAVKETQSNVDIAYILSIEDKVKKKNKYKPNTRAIRDATDHVHFKIEKD